MGTASFEPRDTHYALGVREPFARQGAMQVVGARLGLLEPGAVDVELDWAQAMTQQHGLLQAGMISTALDAACGYAAFALMPADSADLTIEFKINLRAPPKANTSEWRGACSSRVEPSRYAQGALTQFQVAKRNL